MNVIVNYPTDEVAVNTLNERIEEFKSTLIIESINRLNISFKSKKKIVKDLLKGLKAGKYKA